MSSERIKVLYIAGWGRSGSTILSNILGQVEGFFSAGELCYIWDRSLIENRLCGCGERFSECPVWGAIIREAFEGRIDAPAMYELQRRGMRTRHIPLMLLPGGEDVIERRTGFYFANLRKLYRAILVSSGSDVIVDSSKFPSYAYVLSLLPNVEVYIIHLVRDPRAVAFSWGRRKFDPDRQRMFARTSTLKSSLMWSAWNLGSELLRLRAGRRWSYMRLRYEDFVERPQQSLEQILRFVGAAGRRLPFEDARRVTIEPSHIIAGNPNRFERGAVELRTDREWSSKMRWWDKLQAVLLTWPLLLRYRYALLPGRNDK